ncbi:MAG: class I SAM-dependent methyltransferase [Bacteroidales bacterium]
MQERHHNRKLYYDELVQSAREFIYPMVTQFKEPTPSLRVLEVGCGEGGNLLPFVEQGMEVVGVDLSADKIKNGCAYLAESFANERFRLIAKDITHMSASELGGKFDVLIMRDVIEHIPDQEIFIGKLSQFINDDAIIFIAFPPWQMPFGGHQQMIKHRYLCKAPYIHLLPWRMYRKLLQRSSCSDAAIHELLNIKSSGISIERFERAVHSNNLCILKRQLYLINPYYKVKFNLRPRKQLPLLRNIPVLRNFFTTSAYYILAKHASR